MVCEPDEPKDDAESGENEPKKGHGRCGAAQLVIRVVRDEIARVDGKVKSGVLCAGEDGDRLEAREYERDRRVADETPSITVRGEKKT